jgi:hypothetical protein
MSWWSAGGKEGEVIGDEPADAVSGMLSGLGAPAVEEMVKALASALKSKPGFETARIVFKLSTGARVESGGEGADPAMTKAISKGLDSVIESYRSGLNRPPSLREVLENFAFVLGYQPSRFLSGMENIEVDAAASE